jgi:hypothetical protein
MYSTFDSIGMRFKAARAGLPSHAPVHADEALVPVGLAAVPVGDGGNGAAMQPEPPPTR